MIISCTFSKPIKKIEEKLGRPYLRIKIRAANTANETSYFVEAFTEKQAFHEQKSEKELNQFIDENAGKTFKSCVIRTDSEEITVLANKKGEITKLTKKIQSTGTVLHSKNSSASCVPPAQSKAANAFSAGKFGNNARNNSSAASRVLDFSKNGFNKQKNYLIQEGFPVPFMVLLGVMSPEGKIVNSRYDKFRQINRFLEFLNDILPEVQKQIEDKNRPIRIADFGCGKSYLTFAVHYFLTEIKKLNVEIIGLDLKKDVIEYCNKIAGQLNLNGLHFDTGNIADYSYKNNPDIVITLHACDTATDFALDYAVKHDCKAILSVPCCQHEINGQIKNISTIPNEFKPLLKYGIIKEKFCSLITDSLRAEYLESVGYSVQMLEFIDMEHTPKNILIRAVKKQKAENILKGANGGARNAGGEAESLVSALKLNPMLKNLLNG